MEVYIVERDNMKRVPESELDTEANLEERLVRTDGAQIGGVEVLYIGRQGSPGEGGIFDILGVDERGDTVIVELKRDRAPRDIVAQALEYAAEIRNVDYNYLNEQYREFLREEQGYTDPNEIPPLREAHAEYFDRDDLLSEREFNDDQRLVVVGTDFRDVSLNMADFLREHGVDVIAVEYSTYRDEEEGTELLTTDGIRRPLSKEPTTVSSGTTTRGTDYIDLNTRVRDQVFREIGSLLQVESPDELSGKPNRRFGFRSEHPEHPEAVLYSVVPQIEENGSVVVRVGVYGGDDREKQRVYRVVDKHIGLLDDFKMVNEEPKQAIVATEIPISGEEPYSDEVVREIVSKVVQLVEFYHPKFIETSGDESLSGE